MVVGEWRATIVADSIVMEDTKAIRKLISLSKTGIEINKYIQSLLI